MRHLDIVRDPGAAALADERLLTGPLAVDVVPAWTSDRPGRLVLPPGRFVVEPALVGSLLRLDVDAILRHGDLLGRLLEGFVLAQLRIAAIWGTVV